MIPGILDCELLKLRRPAQYLGGEKNCILKPENEITLRFCLAFPDAYEVGMSHLGLHILYHLINLNPSWWAERAFMPLKDMENLLRNRQIPLFSLESKRPLSEFDILGFSLQYELCCTNVLAMLDLGGIPLHADKRQNHHPLVIGGGPLALHPEPYASFFDAFLLGDGEELLPEFLESFSVLKERRVSRPQIVQELAQINGVYAPSTARALYSENGQYAGLEFCAGASHSIRRRILPTLAAAPVPAKPLVPNIAIVHDRLAIELMRGCVRGCRFCQAGFICRPQRERPAQEILDLAGKSLKNSGYEEMSLLSLSSADHAGIVPLLERIKSAIAKDANLEMGMPSSRVDALNEELLQSLRQFHRSGFTLAPEAGSQRLRDVINKGISDQQLLETVRLICDLGWGSFKLYFMIGLPTENDADLEGIAETARAVRETCGRHRTVTINISTFVPKPFTPFQWCEQIDETEILRRQAFLRSRLKAARVNVRFHHPFSSLLEGILARGDRRLAAVIYRAYQLGCRHDAWSEEIQPELWLCAFEECSKPPGLFLKALPPDTPLPWDHLDCGIPKDYFSREWQKAASAQTTPSCLDNACSGCAVCGKDISGKDAIRNVRFETADNITVNQSPQRSNHNKAEELNQGGAELPLKRLRLCYAKHGAARFISHLDVARAFARACRQAALALGYSKGFRPKPRLSFGPPLELGLASRHEFVDLYLSQTKEIPVLISDLNSCLPEGLTALNGEWIELKAPSLQQSIVEHTYSADLSAEAVSRDRLRKDLEDWRNLSICRIRRGKSATYQLGQFLSRLEMQSHALVFGIFSAGYSVKPTEVIAALGLADGQILELRKLRTRFTGPA